MADTQNLTAKPMREWTWSGTEKIAARKAFDLALRKELDSAINEAKERAARISEATELWELEEWLGKRRRKIDSTFDYRYSVLPEVFAGLIFNGLLTVDQLNGIAPEKVDYIRKIVDWANSRAE
jgi:hypothetical protein